MWGVCSTSTVEFAQDTEGASTRGHCRWECVPFAGQSPRQEQEGALRQPRSMHSARQSHSHTTSLNHCESYAGHSEHISANDWSRLVKDIRDHVVCQDCFNAHAPSQVRSMCIEAEKKLYLLKIMVTASFYSFRVLCHQLWQQAAGSNHTGRAWWEAMAMACLIRVLGRRRQWGRGRPVTGEVL